MTRQVFQDVLEISLDQNLSLFDVLSAKGLLNVCEDADALHLMESWVVCPVHCVFSVDVAHY